MPEAAYYLYQLFYFLYHILQVRRAQLQVQLGIYPFPIFPNDVTISPGFEPTAQPFNTLGSRIRAAYVKARSWVDSSSSVVNGQDRPSTSHHPNPPLPAAAFPTSTSSSESTSSSSQSPPTPFDRLKNVPPGIRLPSPEVPLGSGINDYVIRMNLGSFPAFSESDVNELRGTDGELPDEPPISWSVGGAGLQIRGCGRSPVGRRLWEQFKFEVDRVGVSLSMRAQQKKKKKNENEVKTKNTTSATTLDSNEGDDGGKQSRWGIVDLGACRMRGLGSFGKLEIFYFDEFAIAIRMLKQSVLRVGVENHIIAALFAGGFASCLPADLQDAYVQSSFNHAKGSTTTARNLCGNVGVLGFFGAIGYDNNNLAMVSHDHVFQIHFLSYDVTSEDFEEAVSKLEARLQEKERVKEQSGKAASTKRMKKTLREKAADEIEQKWRLKGWNVGKERTLEMTLVPELISFRKVTPEAMASLRQKMASSKSNIYTLVQDQGFLVGIGTSLASTLLVQAILVPTTPSKVVAGNDSMFDRFMEALESLARGLLSPLSEQGLSHTVKTGAAFAFDMVSDRKGRKGIAAVRGQMLVRRTLFDKANEMGYFDNTSWVTADGTTRREDGTKGRPWSEGEISLLLKGVPPGWIRIELATFKIKGKRVGGLYTPFLAVAEGVFQTPSRSFTLAATLASEQELFMFASSVGDASFVPHSIYHTLALVSRGALPTDHRDREAKIKLLFKDAETTKPCPIVLTPASSRYLPGQIAVGELAWSKENRGVLNTFYHSLSNLFFFFTTSSSKESQQVPFVIAAPVLTADNTPFLTTSPTPTAVKQPSPRLSLPPELKFSPSLPLDPLVIPLTVPGTLPSLSQPSPTFTSLPFDPHHPLYYHYCPGFLPPSLSIYHSAKSRETAPHPRREQWLNSFRRAIGRDMRPKEKVTGVYDSYLTKLSVEWSEAWAAIKEDIAGVEQDIRFMEEGSGDELTEKVEKRKVEKRKAGGELRVDKGRGKRRGNRDIERSKESLPGRRSSRLKMA
ncbi:hypothetical protein JCM5353_003967 [Sporobolomyces roseus]